MIDITVKTLDSQNHAFSVEDDITVAQFKEKIAPTVNIPADTQRIIYCGKVLQDNVKLSECDVNGKVVHLVQRPPPPLNQRPAGRSSSGSPQPQRRVFRGFDHGNAMYLGSMAFPSNIMESQGIGPPPPTHTLAASRLNVAGRMLRRAEAVIRLLENPTLRPSEQTPPEEPQEEVTPVFEARIIVPSSDRNEPIDEALVLSAVQDTLLNSNSVSVNSSQAASTTAAENASASTTQPGELSDSPAQHSASTTPQAASPATGSNENLNATTENTSEEPNSNNTSSLPENALPISEMSELLTMLNQLQTRFAPFLERYQNFMQEDPQVASENYSQTQVMINRVSEVLHFLGHAYHSLSDIIIRVRSPPPRPLLCRPILIQHSAVVQTGFPIQVEAQINFSSSTTGGTTNTTNTTTTAPTSASAANTSESTPTTTTSASPLISAQIQPTVVGLPFLPSGGMRVQSIPIEIRGLPRPNNISVSLHRPLNNNHITNPNNVTTQAQSSSTNSTPRTAETATQQTTENTTETGTPQTGETITTTTTNNGRTETTFNVGNFSNPNLEFFMEVTPESITIDSLETALVGSNNAGDILRGALNGPPPDILQSIVQMAGQMMNRHINPTQTATTTVSSSSEPSAPLVETSQTTSVTVGATQATAGQNSQARGNTQTHPTTATHTRSTSRPHVHLAQHAMQGFDPFLPCSSHHVTLRRRLVTPNLQSQNATASVNGGSASRNQREQTSAQSTATSAGDQQQQQLNPLYSMMQGIISSLRNAYEQRGNATPQQNARTATNSTDTASAPSNSATNNTNDTSSSVPLPPFATFLPHLQNMNLSDITREGPTIAQLLPDESYVEGESIFTDLIMLLSQNLTLGDVLQLNGGRLEPLNRIRNELRSFFMSRILDNALSPSSVERGVNRLMDEMQPILDNLISLPVRDDIDVVRSVQMLFRARLPNIINLAASRSPNSLRMLVEQCRITTRQLCALTLHASANGQQGVEEVFNQIVMRYVQGIPNDIQQCTLLTSRIQLRQFMSTLSVPESVLQPYIVRKQDAVIPVATVNDNNVSGDTSANAEPMEVDEQGASGTAVELGAAALNLVDETESLPRVVIGSEPWHNQVPADWVPIIARDSQRQRRQNSQPPFSDAYLSGMPSKRRKIVASSKPQGSLPQVISESVRRAVTTTGLSSVAPLETVAQAAGTDLNVQAAYRELLRTSVQSNLQNNEDFIPDRYPNASHYFNKQP